MQSAALITLSTTPAKTTKLVLRWPLWKIYFSQSIPYALQAFPSLSNIETFPDSFTVWRKAESVTDAENGSLGWKTHRTQSPKGDLKDHQNACDEMNEMTSEAPSDIKAFRSEGGGKCKFSRPCLCGDLCPTCWLAEQNVTAAFLMLGHLINREQRGGAEQAQLCFCLSIKTWLIISFSIYITIRPESTQSVSVTVEVLNIM